MFDNYLPICLNVKKNIIQYLALNGSDNLFLKTYFGVRYRTSATGWNHGIHGRREGNTGA